MDANAERIARNEATFRQANERIRRVADENWYSGLVPFICECADEGCTAIIRLEIADYEQVRSHSRRFLVAPGHDVGGSGGGRVVAEHPAYAIVEKTGEAGAFAEASDARSPHQ